jgi:hypothetical protein
VPESLKRWFLVSASEYMTASFDDVCEVFSEVSERAMAEAVSHPGAGAQSVDGCFPLLRVMGRLRQTTSNVACVDLQWADPSSPSQWEPAELRIILVESGAPPLTELLLVPRSTAPPADGRRLLEGLVAWLEASTSRSSDRPRC